MANNLTPEQLKALQGYLPEYFNPGWEQATPFNSGPRAGVSGAYNSSVSGGGFHDPATGLYFAPQMSQGGPDESPRLTGWSAFDGRDWYSGQKQNLYNPDGTFKGLADIGDPRGETSGFFKTMNVLGPLALAGVAGYGAGLFGNLGAGAGAGLGGSGAFLGEGALSGIPAWDAAMSGAIPAGAAGAADVAALNAATDSALIDTAAGATGVGASGAAGGGGLMSTLGKGAAALGGALGGGSNLLGLGATALGALAGSKGQKNETTATRQLPDYLQGPVTNDLIPRAQGLLAQQMTPERMAGYAAMRQAGQGLLGQPIAGNGFSLFSGRR